MRNGLISLLNNFIIPIRTAKIARNFESSDGSWAIIIDFNHWPVNGERRMMNGERQMANEVIKRQGRLDEESLSFAFPKRINEDRKESAESKES